VPDSLLSATFLTLSLPTMEASPDAYIRSSSQFLRSLSDDDVNRHGETLDLLMERIGPLRGWTKAVSRMNTADELLDSMDSSLDSIRSFLHWDMSGFLINHIQKNRPADDPRLAFSSLRSRSSLIERLLHVCYILKHTTACYGSDVDYTTRVANPEECFKGFIPTYCTKNKLDKRTMDRCIARGSRLDFFASQVGEDGIRVVAVPVISSFSLISYTELQKASDLLRSGHYPAIKELAQQFSSRMESYLEAFSTIIGKCRLKVMST
jgi:hypothetical protein